MKKKSILYSALGAILPAAILIISLPIIAEIYGIKKFGFITLIWSTLGVASLLDLGMARALTNYIADVGPEKIDAAWPAILISFIWASILAAFCFWLLPIYFNSAKELPVNLVIDLLSSVFWISLSIPFVIMFSLFRGVLEGFESFAEVAWCKFTMSILLTGLIVFPLTSEPSVTYVALCFFLGRCSGCLLAGLITVIKLPFKFRTNNLARILIFGGWSSLSALSSSVLVFIDRFVAGFYLQPIVYSTYSVMTDACQRFLILPGSVSAVLFQSSSSASNEKQPKLIKSSLLYIALPFSFLCVFFQIWGMEILTWWLGNDFVFYDLQAIFGILLFGTFLNAVTHVPYSILQSRGYVAITGRLHVFELIVFAPFLIFAASYNGVHGIVLVWFLRILFDCIVQFYLMRNFLNLQNA